MSRYLFRTEKGELLLPLETIVVSRCTIDAAFSIQGLRNGDSVTLRIEGPFRIDEGQSFLELDPSAPRTLGPALALINASVSLARVSESGRLVVKFQDGRTLTVQPNSDFEAWELAGPKDAKAICRVGGGVSTWGATE